MGYFMVTSTVVISVNIHW